MVVVDTPYFAVSDARGEIAIPHVPSGRYQLNLWEEHCAPKTLAGTLAGKSPWRRRRRAGQPPSCKNRMRPSRPTSINTGSNMIPRYSLAPFTYNPE